MLAVLCLVGSQILDHFCPSATPPCWVSWIAVTYQLQLKNAQCGNFPAFFMVFVQMPKYDLQKLFGNTVPRVLEVEIWPIK